jgi:pimeloyl-ACP methyl ester carboxylesterase
MRPRAPTDQYIRIGRISTRFWTAGNAGSPVLLIHGLGRHVEDWLPTIYPLAERHRVFAIDLVASTHSDGPPASYSLPNLVKLVENFLGAQDTGQTSLIGHSLGGSVALHYAILFPSKVSSLVLVSSAGLGKELPLSLRFSCLPILGRWLTHPSREGIANSLRKAVHDSALVTEEWIQLCYHQATLPGAQEALLGMIQAFIDPSGMRDDVIRPISENLTHISVPTLIVWGQQDPILPVAHAFAAKEALPNAWLHVFDPCGHFAQIERCGEFNALVLKFLASTASTTLPGREP